MTAERLLHDAQQLPGEELDHLVEQLLWLRANRRAPSLDPEEARLLQQIQDSVPADALSQRRDLQRQATQRALTGEEQERLIALTNQIESAEAQRIDLMGRLARLRGVSLPQVARQLAR